MSSRFWLLGSGTIVAAACAGMVLGGYATTQPRGVSGGASDYDMALVERGASGAQDMADGSGSFGSGMRPSEPITCKGCGPTLADRRFAADMAGLDADGYVTGTTDAIVQDYLRDESLPPPADLLEPVKARPAPAARVAPLPATIVRIALGGQAQIADGSQPATAATVQVATVQ